MKFLKKVNNEFLLRKNSSKENQKGFTLIQLLVVIAIIGILAGILFVAINPAEQSRKADDAKRIAFVNQLQEALDLYFLDHNRYPNDGSTWGADTYHGNEKTSLTGLKDDLAPYINIDFTANYLGPYWENGDPLFQYRSVSSNNFQTYGLSIRLLSSSNSSTEQSDGGYYSYSYEVGESPRYCMNEYSGSDASWWHNEDSICKGGD